MSTVPPPGTQPPQPPPSTAQAAPTAVIREPSAEVLRLAAGTRVEGTVLQQQPATQTPMPTQTAPTPAQSPAQVDTARAAVQALQTAVDTQKADAAAARRATTPARADAPPTPTQAQTSASPQAQQPAAQVQIRTPVGDVVLRTPLPIPEGARVAFDIANTNASQVTVRLISLNGQPIQQALVQLAADRAAAPPVLPPSPPAASGLLAQPTTLAFGQVWTPNGALNLPLAGPINGFVLAGTSSAMPSLAGQTQPQSGLLSGTDLTVRITSTSPASTGVTPPQGALPGVLTAIASGAISPVAVTTPLATAATGTPVAGAPTTATAGASGQTATAQTPTATGQSTGQSAAQSTAPSGVTTTPTGPGALLPSGGSTQHGLRLIGGQGWPPAPLTTPSQTQQTPIQLALTGTVTAQSTAAQTVIQTSAGDIQLGSRVNLPPGSTVTLEVLTQSVPRGEAAAGTTTAQAAPPPPSVGALPFTAGTAWPVLTEALQLLQRTDPQAGQLLANSLPDGGPRTVVAALSFVQAMRTGDLRQWPGDNNLRALERAGPRGAHLARAVAGEVAQLGAQVRESAGEWRATPMPWNANGQVEKINLITRREDGVDDDDKKEKKGSGTGLRFLLDLDFTQLGAIQLDGMYHEDTKGFDLMVRTHETLDDAIRRDLTGLFVAANQAVGLKGGLTFQVTKKFADPIGSGEPMKLNRDGVWA